MVFMETIINYLVEILKSDTDNISKEKHLGTSIREFVKNVVGKAFEVYDDTLIDSMKEKGYQIEKKVPRTIVTTFGEVSTNRRRYIKPDATPVYPLDEAMGWQKYGRYSLLLVRNLSEFATKVSYRTGELAIRLFAPFTISHQKLNQLVTQAGKEFKKQGIDTIVADEIQNFPPTKGSMFRKFVDYLKSKLSHGVLNESHRHKLKLPPVRHAQRHKWL